MNKAGKWSYEKQDYEPYELPKGAAMIADLDEFVSCASCGERIPFGDSYTSMEIHDNMGLGYAVCPKCYALEMYRRYEYERINDQCE